MRTCLGDERAARRLFDDAIPDPTDSVVLNGIDILKKNKNDAVIGFGGGSPIDTAKAIAVLSQYSKNIQQISCLWKKLFTEIKSNYQHYMWYIQKLNNDIDLPYLKKSESSDPSQAVPLPEKEGVFGEPTANELKTRFPVESI